MKYAHLISFVLLFGLILLACNNKKPQEPDPVRRKSPIAIANIIHQPTDTYLKIVYGQPYKRGRQIFGNEVPFGETWRTGANEATELTTTNDIIFAGKRLDAGTYTLFTIPRKNEPWTIILSSELGQWGDFEYDPQFDVLRVDVPAKQTQKITEAFTIHFPSTVSNSTNTPVITDDSTSIVMIWDQTKVTIPVEFIGGTD
ncbi:MAG TPA: DUF2911 domain-containing protein [Balneolaceae bacterium]|nr:DUF2911 domain-containing protein [Balneolaceae bacterium]